MYSILKVYVIKSKYLTFLGEFTLPIFPVLEDLKGATLMFLISVPCSFHHDNLGGRVVSIFPFLEALLCHLLTLEGVLFLT